LPAPLPRKSPRSPRDFPRPPRVGRLFVVRRMADAAAEGLQEQAPSKEWPMHTALRSVPRLLVLLVVVALPASALAQQTAPPSSSSSSHEGIGIGAKVGPL